MVLLHLGKRISLKRSDNACCFDTRSCHCYQEAVFLVVNKNYSNQQDFIDLPNGGGTGAGGKGGQKNGRPKPGGIGGNGGAGIVPGPEAKGNDFAQNGTKINIIPITNYLKI